MAASVTQSTAAVDTSPRLQNRRQDAAVGFAGAHPKLTGKPPRLTRFRYSGRAIFATLSCCKQVAR
jgi:hypothetical protein